MQGIAWYLGRIIWCFKSGLNGMYVPRPVNNPKQDYLNGWNAALDDAIEKTKENSYFSVSVEYLQQLKHRYQ